MLHCWEDSPNRDGMCMLERGHTGPHVYTPDKEIRIRFVDEEETWQEIGEFWRKLQEGEDDGTKDTGVDISNCQYIPNAHKVFRDLHLRVETLAAAFLKETNLSPSQAMIVYRQRPDGAVEIWLEKIAKENLAHKE